MKSKTPNQIIGVLAHETGHLAGGHLSKMREQLANAQTRLDHRHAARRRRAGRGRRAAATPIAASPSRRGGDVTRRRK